MDTRIYIFIAVASFGLALSELLPSIPGPPADFRCNEAYGVQTYPDPKSCNNFFKCVNGSATYETCENGLLYDGKGNIHNHCNYNWAVDCQGTPADLAELRTGGPCVYAFGLYRSSSGCEDNYLKCAYGEPVLQLCNEGLAYDDNTHTCNWPDLVDYCSVSDAESMTGYSCPSELPANSLSARFAPFPRFDIGECERLVSCVNYSPRLIKCSYDTVFDETSLTCVNPREAYGRCVNFRK